MDERTRLRGHSLHLPIVALQLLLDKHYRVIAGRVIFVVVRNHIREHHEGRHSHTPHINAFIVLPAFQDLRRHERDGAGHGGHAVVEAGRVEVQELQHGRRATFNRVKLAADQMDVRWLDVPMAHTLLMQVEHNLDELLAKRPGFALLQAFRVSDNFLQAWPLKKLQNQIRPNEIQRDHDTTVLAQAEQVKLLLHLRGNLLVRVVPPLHRHELPGLLLQRAVDVAAAARPEPLLVHIGGVIRRGLAFFKSANAPCGAMAISGALAFGLLAAFGVGVFSNVGLLSRVLLAPKERPLFSLASVCLAPVLSPSFAAVCPSWTCPFGRCPFGRCPFWRCSFCFCSFWRCPFWSAARPPVFPPFALGPASAGTSTLSRPSYWAHCARRSVDRRKRHCVCASSASHTSWRAPSTALFSDASTTAAASVNGFSSVVLSAGLSDPVRLATLAAFDS